MAGSQLLLAAFLMQAGDPGADLSLLGWFGPFGLQHITPAVLVSAAIAVAWWWRERVMRRQRRILRGLIALSEEILAAASVREIANRLNREVPKILPQSQAELYLFQRNEDELLRIPTESSPRVLAIPATVPIGTLEGAVALCFRNRALLRIRETRNSPLVERDLPDLPASVLYVPMFAQGQILGVLALSARRMLDTSADLETAAQHLANQVAASMRLQEQNQMREQLLRSEKMAAAGQLISGIAHDLRAPLQAIRDSAMRLSRNAPALSEAVGIESESEKGLEIIDHLLAFSRMEQRQPRPLDLHDLISSLLELRAPERARKNVLCENLLAVSPVTVLADRSQLEQALLTVLVHVEQAAAVCPERTFQATSRVVGGRVTVIFSCASLTAAESESEAVPEISSADDYFGLPVAQVILQTHGGHLRSTGSGRADIRFELDLPIHSEETDEPEPARTVQPARVFTCLLVEPDVAQQRKLLAMLASRGHRAVPAGTAELAADLAQRAQFDIVFCASRAPGLKWSELYMRVRRRIAAFGLLADGWVEEATHVLRSGEGQVLNTPVGDSDLDKFLASVEVRLAARS